VPEFVTSHTSVCDAQYFDGSLLNHCHRKARYEFVATTSVLTVIVRLSWVGYFLAGFAGSKALLQQNSSVHNWVCRLMHVVL